MCHGHITEHRRNQSCMGDDGNPADYTGMKTEFGNKILPNSRRGGKFTQYSRRKKTQFTAMLQFCISNGKKKQFYISSSYFFQIPFR